MKRQELQNTYRINNLKSDVDEVKSDLKEIKKDIKALIGVKTEVTVHRLLLILIIGGLITLGLNAQP